MTASPLCRAVDFGDHWEFAITPMPDVESLLRDKRTTLPKVREAIRKVCTLARPVLLAYDGLNLKEDVGGAMGFPDFLEALEKGRESV
ncbi:MAG: plasmid pRiA4b ORF-3 family protein [Lachnospiraceae bacterium]|nr:plasmid pRiA4b ORF-3 family protein [Lachnospiraceae bacterium]MCH4109088.1 plasmid pRiA4b ORF-3 family protein [Lachnospiraceae bacterium]